jgi:putative membrane protein
MSLIFRNAVGYLFKEDTKVKRFFIIFYIVGALGISFPFTRNLFIFITPASLLISFVAVMFYHQPGIDSRALIVFIIIYLASLLIEIAGVHNGFIFGNYSYGKGLGPKIFDTPLIIGINWLLLVYSANVIAGKLPVLNILKILFSSTLMVVCDLVMEQVAPELKMWNFENDIIPLRNYISWFILAFLFGSLFYLAGIKPVNKIAPLIFCCQIIFFSVLYIFFSIAS